MPQYIVPRTVGEISEEEFQAAARLATEVAGEMPGVRWIRSYYSAEEGKIYCFYEVPDIQLIFEHSRRVGVPVDKTLIVQEMEPMMFR